MAYTPRTAAPSAADKHWIHTSKGGYNRCIIRNSSTGSVLPNCTGYVHGRWMEIGGKTSEYNLAFTNANTYFSHADSFQRGQTPALGAIMCWNSGSAGHVAVVEEIISDDEIVCSESDYSGTRFILRHRIRSTGWNIKGRTAYLPYQGCIYHPDIPGDEPTPEPDPSEDPTIPSDPAGPETTPHEHPDLAYLYPILKRLTERR